MIAWIKRLFDKKHYHNPLYRPNFRNKPCPCKSGKKVKFCCGKYNKISRSEWERIAKFWDNK